MPLAIGVILLFAFLYLSKKDKGAPQVEATGKVKIQPNGKNCKSRGVRNNNPGNIRISSNNWDGKIPKDQNTDGSFEQFVTWVHGLRAMTKLIINYIKGGHDTIAKIINRYAPPIENPTNDYINFVVKETGILANQAIDPSDKTVIRKIIKAMVRMEQGCSGLVTDSEFNKAWESL